MSTVKFDLSTVNFTDFSYYFRCLFHLCYCYCVEISSIKSLSGSNVLTICNSATVEPFIIYIFSIDIFFLFSFCAKFYDVL